ncbi:hypothetical protein PoB_006996700 [Plakobranchus ocellatus]|uniref:Uncharacterized protein n=1 Tax=Plakobranchus ocellatus TaxID=259542 RepID=A0AAV4DHJ1_9GAST|nr:hypothetical protein PoB_006996700 [Plakobranchus ocellatus]
MTPGYTCVSIFGPLGCWQGKLCRTVGEKSMGYEHRRYCVQQCGVGRAAISSMVPWKHGTRNGVRWLAGSRRRHPPG